MFNYRKLCLTAAMALFSTTLLAENYSKPVIGIVGASYEEAKSPFNNGLVGFTIGQGEGYIDLSSMLERKRALIINEAQRDL